MRHSRSFWMLLFCVLSVCACTDQRKSSAETPKGFAPSLIVLPGANEVKFEKSNGADQVSYKLQVDYPAESVLEVIRSRLAKQGWKTLQEDFLNPGLPSSHVRGWTDLEDWSKEPKTHVHQWLAQWQNNSGDIVLYTLQYRYPKDKPPDMRNLQIHAAYIPARIADQMKSEVLRGLPRQK
jgi:hypothetical protein